MPKRTVGAKIGLSRLPATANPTSALHIAMKPPTIAPYAMWATSITTGVASP